MRASQPGVEGVAVNAEFVSDIAGSTSLILNEVDGIELHFVGVFAARCSHEKDS